jgi:hypothetical protein
MLRVERHDDVVRLAAASPVGRAVGYSASAYLVDRAGAAATRARSSVDTLFARAGGALVAALAGLGRRRAPRSPAPR